MSLFKDQNPEQMKEYDYEKNSAIGLDIDVISCSSNKRAFWKCQTCGGAWEASFAERNRCKGCPYCTGRRVLEGYNDLKTRFPEIANEWDYEKNGSFLPTMVAAFSMKSAFWVCKMGHSYSTSIALRTSQKQGCPYCSGKRGLRGFNDLESRFPEVAKEWNYQKNAPLVPAEITYGSSKKVWWKCKSCGNEWISDIASRTRGQGCRTCGNKRGAEKRKCERIKRGISLSQKEPWVLAEWDYSKNTLSPNNITPRSHERCWWICAKGHSYDLAVADKANGQGCPYCAGKRVLPGFNDVESCAPELLSDWDYKSNAITPKEITYGSDKSVFWKCQNCGKPYKLSVQEKRRRANKYCIACKKEFGSSIPEQTVFFYISQVFPDAINGYRNTPLLGTKELDIFIPSINTGIEYDGRAWHDNKKRDKEKSQSLIDFGIKLIRLRETGAPEIEDGSYVIPVSRKRNEADYSFLQKPIEELMNYFAMQYNIPVLVINIENNIHDIISGFLRLQKENSLAECYPNVAKELHPTKNLGLDPTHIGCRSGQMVWWQCPECGHEWRSRVIDRTTKGYGCRSCGNRNATMLRIKRKLAIDGSFADRYPELLKDWDYEKNGSLLPSSLTVSSGRPIWWKCTTCGYEWIAKIADRTKGEGCIKCGIKRAHQKRIIDIIKNEGSLADNYPEIAAEWDYVKNTPSLPSEFTYASNKKFWWKCKTCSFEWESRISQRTRGQGCPRCYKNGIVEGQISMFDSSFQ